MNEERLRERAENFYKTSKEYQDYVMSRGRERAVRDFTDNAFTLLLSMWRSNHLKPKSKSVIVNIMKSFLKIENIHRVNAIKVALNFTDLRIKPVEEVDDQYYKLQSIAHIANFLLHRNDDETIKNLALELQENIRDFGKVNRHIVASSQLEVALGSK